jgi:hypothetical protein
VKGNWVASDVATLATGTAAVPLFDSVTTTVVGDVEPTPVGGNARPGHVMTNVDGVTVVGVVGVLLEQLAASATIRAKAAIDT